MVVAEEIIIRMIIVNGWLKFITRIRMYTPAVTRVDEWTKAEIGVGAAIAAGSQEENGNWALLEMAAIRMSIETIVGYCSFIVKFQFIFIIKILIVNRIAISPKRLEKIVISPDDAEE